jgi:hypothetical protein
MLPTVAVSKEMDKIASMGQKQTVRLVIAKRLSKLEQCSICLESPAHSSRLILSCRNQMPPIFPVFYWLLETEISNDKAAAAKIAKLSVHGAACVNTVQ